MGRMFRAFADANKADLKALAACIRGSRQVLTREEVGRIFQPVLVAIGTRDLVSGPGQPLVDLLPDGTMLDIPNPRPQPRRGRQGVQGGRSRIPETPALRRPMGNLSPSRRLW